MKNVQVMDCTLRDGGYCNDWNFGYDNIIKIINGLSDSNVEIIECGFITNKTKGNPDSTRFSSFESVSNILPQKRDGSLFVAMINYGEYDVDDIPAREDISIDGIRVAFHKRDVAEAIELCKRIKEKGYLVFIQPMVSLSYLDGEFLRLIRMANEIEPYAFYIVDSFGAMKEKELIRLFYLVENNLNENIWIGYHSHNNMQLAYSNAQKLTRIDTDRNLIIDSCIFGMGRGAGNLNSEIFLDYLNQSTHKEYRLKPLLSLIDEVINEYYLRNYWGYSLPNYISAAHNAHPNYAVYLDEKKSLTIESMNEIFDIMDEEKKEYFDKKYIENLYMRYMEQGSEFSSDATSLYSYIYGKSVLLIAPGKSSIDEKDRIRGFISSKNNLITISVNHLYPLFSTDFVFISNLRRFRELKSEVKGNYIITSNIVYSGNCFRVCYRELLNDTYAVSDNSGLMAIKLMIIGGVERVYLAGFDGYTHETNQNYGSKEMELVSKSYLLDSLNAGMNKVIKEYSRLIPIEFVTNKHMVDP